MPSEICGEGCVSAFFSCLSVCMVYLLFIFCLICLSFQIITLSQREEQGKWPVQIEGKIKREKEESKRKNYAQKEEEENTVSHSFVHNFLGFCWGLFHFEINTGGICWKERNSSQDGKKRFCCLVLFVHLYISQYLKIIITYSNELKIATMTKILNMTQNKIKKLNHQKFMRHKMR